MIRVLMSGAGKMGRVLVDGLSAESDFEIVGVVDKFAAGDTFARAAGEPLPLLHDAGAACGRQGPTSSSTSRTPSGHRN
jgi:hypothetical protein